MAMVVIVAARRRRRPTRITPQRCGCCERGGEERQERRASKMKVTARIQQVNITILHRALRLRQRLQGCGLLWYSCGAQNVTAIQRVPQIDFFKNRENEWTREVFLLVLKWGAALFLAVFLQLAGPFGK